MDSRKKKLTQYVVPTILGNCAYFLFTIIDGIFVGQGVGTDALGAVNLVWPFVMVLNAIIMLTVVGGVTVSAVRIGRGDIAGANQAFMHSLAGTLTAAIIMTLIGTCLTSQIATLLGANETYHQLVCDYLFWYSLFAVPSGLMTFMNNYCRNDGSPVLVSVGSTIATGINIFLDWLFVFPLQKGLMGAAIATGISQTCGMLIVSTHFILRRGQLRVGRFRFSGKLAQAAFARYAGGHRAVCRPGGDAVHELRPACPPWRHGRERLFDHLLRGVVFRGHLHRRLERPAAAARPELWCEGRAGAPVVFSRGRAH